MALGGRFLLWVAVFGLFVQEEAIWIIQTTTENPSCTCNKLESIPHCPSNFQDASNICYNITPPSPYPPNCPFQNTIPFNTYKDVVSTDAPIWIPVQRDVSDGLGFLEWVEPSTLYKTEFQEDFHYEGKIKGKDCVVYHKGTFQAVPCDEEYSGICAYYKLDQDPDQMCSSFDACHQSDFNADSKCFCLGGSDLDQSKYVKAELLKPYQNSIYSLLTLDDCTMGLERVNGSYLWVHSKQPMDYCYWSNEAEFGSTNVYGAVTKNGWVLTQEPLYCFLFEKKIDIPEPELHLTYNSTTELFHLEVLNSAGLKKINTKILLYCFSNAGAYSLTYRYPDLTCVDEGRVYEFKPYINGPGSYWCEAFKYVDSQPIKSEVLFVNQTERFGVEFVTILKTEYIQGTNPLHPDMTGFLERIFFVMLTINHAEFRCTYASRIMQIIDIDEERNEAIFNIHFTCNIRQSAISPIARPIDDEYDKMEELINQTVHSLPDINIEMMDFRSATYCLEETLDGLTWPRTERGHKTVPQEYCFSGDGILIKRLCGGDFIHGAIWGDAGNCTIPSMSTVTEELLKIIEDVQDPLDDVYNISNRYSEFDNLDVYLVALIARDNWKNITQANLWKFVATLDNLLKVNGSTLTGAQYDTRAIDMIFDTIDNVVTEIDINSTNIVTLSGNSTGIALMADGTVVELTGDHICDTLVESYENLEGAICLNSVEDTQLVFKVFLNNLLFKVSEPSNNSIRKVFGTLDFNATSTSVYTLYKVPNGTAEEDCVYWSYDLESPEGRGEWKLAGQSQRFSTYLKCTFFNVTTSALTTITTSQNNDSESITENLEKLLHSDETPSEIINILSSLTDRYKEFDADDVYLVGEILEKIRNEPDIDLGALAHIVSNLQEIERGILSESQKKKNATDAILHSVDGILQNHNYGDVVNITENNFVIYMTKVKDTDFSGLILLDDHNLQTLNLTGNVTVEDVLKYDFATAFVLPSRLKQQLVDDDLVIVTIFSSDDLFNEDTAYQKVSKIFGVILPLVDNYSEPLSFIYKVSVDDHHRSCVYWLYNKPGNILGSWKVDSGGKEISSFSQCDFWHTTHFGLLVLDSDKYDNAILTWITTINCALSMFGFCCIILTGVFFKRWRTNSGNQILLNFVFVSVLQICIFYTSNSINKNSTDKVVCTIIGVVLHYSIVSQFCWMFVIAILQFKRFVEVLTAPPKHVLLKACLCGWVLPCLPVACVYFLVTDTYVNGNVGLCYPSGLGLYLGVWLPIAIVVVVNFVIFVYIIYSVVHKKTKSSDSGNGDVMFQWRLAILLFFMLGMTWSFGFLSELNFGEVFVYVFCFTATLQGFVMFLFFIVFNANTRYLYVNACKKHNKY